MSTAFGQSKIAYVNTQVIIDTLPAKDTAEMALANLAKQYDESIRNLQMEIQGKQKEYEAKSKVELLKHNWNCYKKATSVWFRNIK